MAIELISKRSDRLYFILEPHKFEGVQTYPNDAHRWMVWHTDRHESTGFVTFVDIPNNDTPQEVTRMLETSFQETVRAAFCAEWSIRKEFAKQLIDQFNFRTESTGTVITSSGYVESHASSKLVYIDERFDPETGSLSFLYVIRGDLVIDFISSKNTAYRYLGSTMPTTDRLRDGMSARDTEEFVWLADAMKKLQTKAQ